MDGHDADCNGQCGWTRTLCGKQWAEFFDSAKGSGSSQ